MGYFTPQAWGMSIIMAWSSSRPAGGEQFQGVVEAGRIAAGLVDDRQELRDVVAEQVGAKAALARAHPVEVAAQGVDLAVVGQVAEGLGQLPGGEGVGAVALVHDGQRALEAGVVQSG